MNISHNKTRYFRLILILIVFVLLFNNQPLFAQFPPPQQNSSDQQIQQMLLWQDKQVSDQFNKKYMHDYRLYPFMNTIWQRINLNLPAVYGNKPYLQITCDVYVSHLGFNAVTYYRIILFDSLLLDTLKHLADDISVYGGLDNQYTKDLVGAVAFLCRRHQTGNIHPNISNQQNPFNLPEIPNMTPQQKQESLRLFTNMVASWIAHEASHAFLEHILQRMKMQQSMQAYNKGNYSPQQMQEQIQYYLNYTLGPQMELEADAKGAELLLKSGYDVDGFIWWLKFADLLESALGLNTSYVRTHPTSEQRIENILKVKQKFSKKVGSNLSY